MSLQQIFQEFLNWISAHLSEIWNYPLPWQSVMWWGIGIIVALNVVVFIGAFFGAYVVERYRMVIAGRPIRQPRK